MVFPDAPPGRLLRGLPEEFRRHAAAHAALRVLGISDPDALVKAPRSFEVPVKAPIAGLVVEPDVAAGQLLQNGVTQCFMISDVSTVSGAGECLSERFALRTRPDSFLT
jgi:hypothetical protein